MHVKEMAVVLSNEFGVCIQRRDVIMNLWKLNHEKMVVLTREEKVVRLAWLDHEPPEID